MAVSVNNKKPKGHAPVSELFKPTNLGFAPKEAKPAQKRKFSFKITSRRRKRYRSECYNHSNLLKLTHNTEVSAPQLLQGYKYCYYQLGIIQKYSERKGLLARRDTRSGASQVLFLHLLFSLICFGNKNNAISAEAIKGEPLKVPHKV